MTIDGMLGLGRAAGWRRVLAVLGLASAIALEILSTLHVLPSAHVGRIPISASTIPALLVVALVGGRLLGPVGEDPSARIFWRVAPAALAALGFVYLEAGRGGEFGALVVAAVNEEVLYRLAVPVVVAGVLVSLGVRLPVAQGLGFTAGAIWFVSLPGHLAQMTTVADLVPFAAFAIVAALVVARSGAVLATSAVHAASNLVTFLVLDGEGSAGVKIGLTAGLLGLLVLAFGQRSSRRRVRAAGEWWPLVDLRESADAVVIDLRDAVLERRAAAASEPPDEGEAVAIAHR